MQPHGLGNIRTEVPLKPACSELLMAVIDIVVRAVLRQVVKQVANIVQKGGGDRGAAGAGSFRRGRSLKRMLCLTHWFPDVGGVAAFSKQIKDVIDDGVG